MKSLTKFLIWLFFGLVVCFWGITHTYAWTDKTIYSDSSRTQSNKYLYGSNPNGGIATASINTNISGASYGFSFWTNEPVVLNKTYTLKINFMGDDLYNTFSSNFVTVATCYSSTCNDNTIISIEKSTNSGRSTWLKINFNPASTGDYLFVGLSSDSTPLTAIAGPVAFGISSVQIEATNESQNIIDNQTNNTNNIINNQNNNTQDIIDNQNSIAQQQEENQKVCESIDKNYLELDNKYINNTGVETNSPSGRFAISSYIQISKQNKLKALTNYTSSGDYMCFYDINKTKISCIAQSTLVINDYITIPDNTSYFRFTIQKEVNKPVFELCKNGNQAMQDTLTDTNSASFDSSMINLIPNAPITNLLTIPISLLQNLLTRFNNTCSPITIPFLYNQNITFPCFTISDYLGSTANIIDLAICFVMVYNIIMLFVSVFEDITTLRDGFLGLYEPQHAYTGYHPKHGKE